MLVVIRIGPTHLKESAPCCHCLNRIKEMSRRGYNVNSVYYSTEQGNIVREKFDQLLSTTTHISSLNRLIL